MNQRIPALSEGRMSHFVVELEVVDCFINPLMQGRLMSPVSMRGSTDVQLGFRSDDKLQNVNIIVYNLYSKLIIYQFDFWKTSEIKCSSLHATSIEEAVLSPIVRAFACFAISITIFRLISRSSTSNTVVTFIEKGTSAQRTKK
ncbi:hypothetical protein [Deinococcus sedimenti]|uniref:hypothetical protein n=1 Tax=Deinococcus sedimenti TaxID=1867090 RepID=UPI00166DB0A1|nr:hypothetical protein [Deinococcus sedimenti]